MSRTAAPARLGIFVKEPTPGRVKTRLCPPLMPAEAARFYRVAMRETVERFAGRAVPVVLFYKGNPSFFQREFPQLPLIPQVEGDLGERMSAALSALLGSGCRAAALIGSDSPDLPGEMVDAALEALAGNDVVTVPAADGGYVLVGCRRPCPEIFTGIPWSSGQVLAATRRQAERHGIRYCETGCWRDVDDAGALLELVATSPGSATARYIKRHLLHRLRGEERER